MKNVFFRDRRIDNQPNHRMITFEAKFLPLEANVLPLEANVLPLEAHVLTKRCNGTVAWQRHE